MATEKRLNSRIILKNDTTTNWNKATGFIPKKGEPIIVADEGEAPILKIGDGSSTIPNLPSIGGGTGASWNYGTELPASGEEGQLFFLIEE